MHYRFIIHFSFLFLWNLHLQSTEIEGLCPQIFPQKKSPSARMVPKTPLRHKSRERIDRFSPGQLNFSSSPERGFAERKRTRFGINARLLILEFESEETPQIIGSPEKKARMSTSLSPDSAISIPTPYLLRTPASSVSTGVPLSSLPLSSAEGAFPAQKEEAEESIPAQGVLATPLRPSTIIDHTAVSPFLSPHCRSGRSGCIDPRVLKASLNYYTRGVFNNLCDIWHTEKLKILEEIYKKNQYIFGQRNFALAGFHMAYQDQKGGVHFSAIHDVPFLFLSGAENLSEAFQASFHQTKSFSSLVMKNLHNFIDTSSTPLEGLIAIKGLISRFFTPTKPTRLSQKTIRARAQEIRHTSRSEIDKDKEKRTHPKRRCLGHFPRIYYHSEQAILAMLTQRPDVLDSILGQLPRETTVLQVSIMISTDRQMCRCCGATYFRAAEGGGPLKETLETYIKNFQEKDLKIPESSLNIHTQVSALRPFDSVYIHHWIEQWANVEAPIMDSCAFSPHVAQLYLPHHLTKRQKDEIKTYQSSKEAKDALLGTSDSDF